MVSLRGSWKNKKKDSKKKLINLYIVKPALNPVKTAAKVAKKGELKRALKKLTKKEIHMLLWLG